MAGSNLSAEDLRGIVPDTSIPKQPKQRYMITELYRKSVIIPRTTIVEAESENAAIEFAKTGEDLISWQLGSEIQESYKWTRDSIVEL